MKQTSKFTPRGLIIVSIFVLVSIAMYFIFFAPQNLSQIKSDENVIFFPTSGYLDEAGKNWIADIHGWIYEPETDSIRRNLMIDQLASGLKLVPDSDRDKAFRARMIMFLADNERSKDLQIRIGDQIHNMGTSQANGHFTATIKIPVSTSENLIKSSGSNWLSFNAITNADDQRKFIGRIQLLAPTGVSVISDIDDTIKISNVIDKTQLVINTFILPYKPAPGMAEAYGHWAKQGASFHYVSSSPWQLYPALSEFMSQSKFPDGGFHLKTVRFKDTSLANLVKSSVKTKPPIIEGIIKKYPKRRYILVGDSGEKDPEVYGLIARNHPLEVMHIYIRKVKGAQNSDTRFAAAFKDVPADKWTVFTDAAKLTELDLDTK